MVKIPFYIPIPTFIESIIVYFLLRYRKKHYDLAFRRIKLTKEKYAIVDPEDYQKLIEYDWHLFAKDKKEYAVRFENGIILRMHRLIMNAPKGKIIDHKDGNGLNNTKENLRFATHSQNSCNRRRTRKNCTSKYRGVTLARGKWRAAIKCAGKTKFLGSFDNEEEAARAYDEAAKKYHGEFAMLNFNEDSHEEVKRTDCRL